MKLYIFCLWLSELINCFAFDSHQSNQDETGVLSKTSKSIRSNDENSEFYDNGLDDNWRFDGFESSNSTLLSKLQVRWKQNCDCGKENWSDRIVGGDEVYPKHRYPWLVAVRFGGHSVICGGALITNRHVLTAAHCLVDLESNEIDVILGAHDLSDNDGQAYRASKLLPHEGYSRRFHVNDIGLIELATSIDLSTSSVGIICLPPVNGGRKDHLIVAGWGRIEQGGLSSNVLLHAPVKYINQSNCESAYPGSYINEKNFCAGQVEHDACQGDSGGPLMQRNVGQTEIAGIISFGRGCGQADSPGVYTDVAKYLNWIEMNTKFSGCYSVAQDTNLKQNEVQLTKGCGLTTGTKSRTKRIVGGNISKQLEYPWIAAIGYRGQLIGAGSLVAPNLVLTTASCIRPILESSNFSYGQLSVILGASDITKRESGRRSFKVSKIIIHPDHRSSAPYNHDFALLRLTVQATSFTSICLPTEDTPYPVDYAVRSLGWGRTSPTSRGSTILRQANLKLINRNECLRFYSEQLSNGLFCAKNELNEAPCYGDYGGPLMIQFGQRFYLAGHFSHVLNSAPCGQNGSPSLFADTRHVLNWLHDNIANLS